MARPELVMAQAMREKPVYRLDGLLRVAGSRATAYRVLGELREAGFAEQVKAGYFEIRSSLFQPFYLWKHLAPSLEALKQARRFGRSYNGSDIKMARQLLNGTVTLDYRAYELTGLQAPHSLFTYVADLDSAATALRERGFWEGTRGRVVILPHMGQVDDELQRVYLDCIAYGGRSTLDAIAIEIIYSEHLDPKVRGAFKSEDVLKVREELVSRELGARNGNRRARQSRVHRSPSGEPLHQVSKGDGHRFGPHDASGRRKTERTRLPEEGGEQELLVCAKRNPGRLLHKGCWRDTVAWIAKTAAPMDGSPCRNDVASGFGTCDGYTLPCPKANVLAKFIRKAGCLLTVSILSYLNPKRAAALDTAKDLIQVWKDQDEVHFRLKLVKVIDEAYHKMVIEELAKYGLSVSVDG